uniref:Uncharacterized protein n=1 Tax=Cacopsylla melanoneura TaxID=428564 RepID=A0A8D8QLF9_9HEMI
MAGDDDTDSSAERGVELKVLTGKQEQSFKFVQELHDAARNLQLEANAQLLERRISSLEHIYTDYVKTAERVNILTAILKPTAKISFTDVSTIQEMYGYIKFKFVELKKPTVDRNSTNVQAGVQHDTSIRLKPLDIPMFMGEQGEWPMFFEIFKANVHSNQALPDSHKLQYLLSKLGGSALSVCAGIPPSNENYLVIYNALVDKYQDTRNLATHYLDNILQFKASKVESANHLNIFVDQIGASVAALKSLEIPDLTEFLLFYLASSKLDDSTKRLFENSVKKGEMPNFKELLEFVQNQAKILSRVHGGIVKAENVAQPKTKLVQYNNKKNVSHSFVVKKNSCKMCPGDHGLFKCNVFLNLSPVDRYGVVKQNNLCVNCLSSGHRATNCPSKSTCNVCHLNHNSLLHFNQSTQVSETIPSLTNRIVPSGPTGGCISNSQSHNKVDGGGSSPQSSNTVSLSVYSPPAENYNETTVLLGTVKILVFDVKGNPHQMRFLLDCASMSNILSLSACNQLGLSPKAVSTDLKGMGSISSPVQGQVTLKFGSMVDKRCNYTIKALVVNHIVDELPVKSVDTSQLDYLANIVLADDEFMTPGVVSGILGAQIYPHLMSGKHVFGNGIDQPAAMGSTLGYVLMGNAPTLETKHKNSYCMFQCDFERFWQLDHVEDTISSKLTDEEQKCEQHFVETKTRDPSGRYMVSLPFNSDPTQLGNSYQSAKRRFFQLEKRLENNTEASVGYRGAMQDLLDKGYMAKCDNQSDVSGYFIPHHMVMKPDSVSTKLRVVFDASAQTTSGKSLNDLLYSGPKLYSDLFSILLNFRLFPFALNGDITKMFLQILVNQDDCKYQKLLWRFHKDEPLASFEMKVVVFGMKSSPFLAQRTVRQLVEDEVHNFPGAAKINTFLYMDDCVASFLTESEAKLFYRDVVQLFKVGGFTFTKWISNSSQIMNVIPEADQLTKLISFDDQNNAVKILGMSWNASLDLLYFKIMENKKPCTKRGILSAVLTIYDPMGLISPVVLWVKLLIRELCILKLDWDSTPPEQIVSSWLLFKNQLVELGKLHFPRHIGVRMDSRFQLIGFCDASQKGYGAIIYSKVTLSNGDSTVNLVCAKSKVAPLKVESIPRLELCSLLLLAKLMKIVLSNYANKYELENYYCLTDSTVALCWSHGSPHNWQTFVANRVTKIQENLVVDNIYHVKGLDNPADAISRGQMPLEFVNNTNYFHGPSWLLQDRKNWPITTYDELKGVEVPEQRQSVTLVGLEENNVNPLQSLFLKFSSWPKLLNTIVFFLRFIKKLPRNNVISANDVNKAEQFVVGQIQKCSFQLEMKKIQKNENCSSGLRKLSPIIDGNLLRVGGRLTNANLSFDQQHPMLLPAKHQVTHLIVSHYHKINLHAGPQLLLSILRQKFWIIGGRNMVRKIVQNCNSCFKNSPKFIFPKMGDLPAKRVLESKPFFHSACDFLGPFHIVMQKKRGSRPVKVYICLFICLAVKAIHLEVVSELSTAAFLNAFKRFLSRRGPVKSMLSDNGTNFVGARNKLNEIYTLLQSSEYKDCFGKEMLEHRIEWRFNPPGSPHFGGIFEGNVKSFKTHFYRVVGNQLLSLEELWTLTVQIEGVLNSRPLCALSPDPSETPLTPNHFLNMSSLKHIPAECVENDIPNRLTRFQLLDQIVQSFWRKWSLEYLHELQVRAKWNTPSCPVRPGLVVLVRQANTAPLSWPMGVVTRVCPGKDNIVRVAIIRTSRGEFERAVTNLCPLPTQ